MNADANADDDWLWDAIVRCWGAAYTFSHDRQGHPDEPHAAHRKDGHGTLRAASPAELLDAIKDDAAARPFAPAPGTPVPGAVPGTENHRRPPPWPSPPRCPGRPARHRGSPGSR